MKTPRHTAAQHLATATLSGNDAPDASLKRRQVIATSMAAAMLSGIAGGSAQAQGKTAAPLSTAPLTVAMLVYSDMILLDLVGPQTMLGILGARILLVGKTRAPVTTDVGVPVTPTASFAECPEVVDVLFVPGGLKGSVALMDDAETLAFLAERGAKARYVTSVCTGGLVLGAAGLLMGYRATTHWYVRDLLPLLGATVVSDRVVQDRNRVTGGGVTAGLDFGLAMAALLRGEEDAKRVQLVLEYDPKPRFQAGEPEDAGAALVGDVRARRAPLLQAAAAASRRAHAKLRI